MKNEVRLIEAVKSYIQDRTYSYALLINGEWGSGKTYFVTKKLIPELEKREKIKIKYTSLYGCETLTDIEENILLTINEKTKNQVDEIINIPSKKVKKKIASYSKELIKIGVEHHFPYYSRLLHEAIQTENCLFFLDDVERCKCSINDVFALVNSLVEQRNTKVVLLANENEIEKNSKEEKKELQYLAVLGGGIYSQQHAKNKGKEEDEIQIDVLEKNRKILFPDEDIDKQYQRIKEKVVGVTLKFVPDFKETAVDILENMQISESHKKVILTNLNQIANVAEKMSHTNFRTFQFFVSKMEGLFDVLDKMVIDEKNRYKVHEIVLMDCLETSICSKLMQSSIKISSPTGYYVSYRRFVTVNQWVNEGYLNREKFCNEINNYIETQLSIEATEDDVFWKLYNQWNVYPMKEIEQMVITMIENLRKDSYSIELYWKIIYVLGWLCELGIVEDYRMRSMEIMKDNIRKKSVVREIDTNLIFISDISQRDSVLKNVNILNDEIRKRRIETKDEELCHIFSEDNWAEKFDEYVKEHNSESDNLNFLGGYSATQWANELLHAAPKTIDTFRHTINTLYPKHMYHLYDDLSDVNLLIDVAECVEGEIDNVTDMVSKQNLRWFIQQVHDISKVYLENN